MNLYTDLEKTLANVKKIQEDVNESFLRLSDIFSMLNSYAENPYDFNGKFSSTSPHQILADTYYQLAAIHQLLQKHYREEEDKKEPNFPIENII